MSNHSTLCREELDAILAGLRLLQHHLERGSITAGIIPIYNGGESHGGLDSESLDDLCERINCGELLHDASRQSTPDTPDSMMSPPVEAEAWPDGRPFTVTFQANHYFAHANEQDIIALACCDWSLDYPADWVVEYTASFDSEVNRVFEYLSVADKGGFECSVNGNQAMAWLKRHRPGVWAQILCNRRGVRLVQATEDEVRGRWDWIDDAGSDGSETSHDTAGEAALDAARCLSLENDPSVA